MAKYIAGVYRAKAFSVRGMVVMEAEFTEDRLIRLEVADHDEIRGQAWGFETTPFENFIPLIVEYQSLAVPFVKGADAVCYAIVKATGKCIKKAGGNSEEWEKIKLPVPEGKADSTEEFDVVIFGSGMAGMAAAVEAVDCGLRAAVVEKQDIIGGASLLSGGKIMAGGSSYQKALGIKDSPEMVFNFLKGAAGGFLDDAKISYFSHKTVENLEWIVSKGHVIEDIEPAHSSQYPWRIHNAPQGQGQTMGWGGNFIIPLYERFIEKGGTLFLHTSLEELIRENGKVTGAVTEDVKDGSKIRFKADNIILATGGFAANREYVEANYPWMKDYFYNCPETSQGDGLVAAEKIGALNYHHPFLQTMLLNDRSGAGVNEESGLIVTREGKRFCNEYRFHSLVGASLADTGSAGGWYITCGDEPFDMLNYALTLPITPSADSIGELAEKIGIEPKVLENTVKRYNYLCSTGFDEDFEKPADKMHAIKGPKYYAVFLKPATSITFGGLKIDIAGHVIDTEGRAIPGLLAAGEVANTGNFGHGVPACGYSLGHALCFGRNAARTAAGRELP